MASSIPVKTQVSAGGVAFRKEDEKIWVALTSVGEENRWQLPKGTVGKGESTEDAALREVREEAGLQTELLEHIDRIEYWFYSKNGDQRMRIHKYVVFYLLRFLSGDVADHDWEVNEARWFEIDDAIQALTFESEKSVVMKAKKMIWEL
jgi:8-oxo-dGTP pyrophosphatase MutT (NUDIX family)